MSSGFARGSSRVRDNLISSRMATSLMNDSATAIKIACDLVDVSSLLYLQRDSFLDVVEEEVLSAAAWRHAG